MLLPVTDDGLDGTVAVVTGGGRGIGARIARELAEAGARVAVAARSGEQVERVAREIGGVAFQLDVADETAVARMVTEVERELGPIDVLVNAAGVMRPPDAPSTWEENPADWWRVFEVNVLGAYLCCRAALRGMVERGRGRIISLGSAAGYLPVTPSPLGGTSYGASKAALYRFGEMLAVEVAPHGIAVFTISPGLVRSGMTESLGDGAPWTPPELAPRLVRVLAGGRADGLSGRYIHAEHDSIEDLIERADEITERDLNAIRLRR